MKICVTVLLILMLGAVTWARPGGKGAGKKAKKCIEKLCSKPPGFHCMQVKNCFTTPCPEDCVRTCEYNDQIYAVEESFPSTDGCNKCTCTDTDKIACTEMYCPPVCNDLLCDVKCEYGNVLDKTGCPSCECNPPPLCGPMCKMYCEHGFELDTEGCPLCKCNPAPVCGPVCMMHCEYGNVLDKQGCPICECKPPPV